MKNVVEPIILVMN